MKTSKKSFSLNQLKVKSFVTNIPGQAQCNVVGGSSVCGDNPMNPQDREDFKHPHTWEYNVCTSQF